MVISISRLVYINTDPQYVLTSSLPVKMLNWTFPRKNWNKIKRQITTSCDKLKSFCVYFTTFKAIMSLRGIVYKIPSRQIDVQK